jgi:fatty acid desaturase
MSISFSGIEGNKWVGKGKRKSAEPAWHRYTWLSRSAAHANPQRRDLLSESDNCVQKWKLTLRLLFRLTLFLLSLVFGVVLTILRVVWVLTLLWFLVLVTVFVLLLTLLIVGHLLKLLHLGRYHLGGCITHSQARLETRCGLR